MIIWALMLSLAHGAFIDTSGPSDTFGRPQVDLYDVSGNQRGTTATPLNIALPPGAATSALQTTSNNTLNQILANQPPLSYSSKTIFSNATTVIKTGSGVLRAFIINNNATGGVLYLYDNTSGSGTIIATGNAGTPSGGLLSGSGNPGAGYVGPLDVVFTNGLTAVTQGSTQNSFTVIYK